MKNFLLNNVSLDSLTTLFSQAPVALAMLMGEDQVVEIANKQILDLWGKDASVIGLPILEAIPEIRDQEFPRILKNVYNIFYDKKQTKSDKIMLQIYAGSQSLFLAQ